jgi:NarL family two-component system response regulator YdfI
VISVLVNCSNLIMQAGLESIIATNPALQVVGSATAKTTLGARVEEVQPDVVLLEWEGDEQGLLVLAFVSELTAPAIVVLSDHVEQNWAELLNNPVQAILPRRATAEQIIASIVAAALGLVVLHPDFSEELWQRNNTISRVAPSSPIQALTGREIEVLGMLALGLGNKTIAKELGISEHTVKFHLSSIFGKLNASSRTEAVTLGARLGLILL